MLKAVFDHHKYIDLVEIPNEPEGPPYVYLAHDSGNIVLERLPATETASSAWKFSAQTLKTIPALYEVFKDRPLAKGVTTTVQMPFSIRMKDFFQSHLPTLRQTNVLLENWQ
jgi:hypothetical protein